MKIVFYSTNSNHFDAETFKINVLPQNEESFSNFIKKYPEYEFICVTQAPGMFMPEADSIVLEKESDYKTFAEKIISLKPDYAIAMTFWVAPYDWLTINDALVSEELENVGIKTICNSVETGLICFDKYRTQQFLSKNGYNLPQGIFVDHDLYFCAGSHKEVIQNIYKKSVENQIRKLKLPLIIKDTVGLSSYGMTVVHTYGEAMCYLNSKRNNSNRIVEEYINGEQFGTEIYGVPGNYNIMPPFRFTTNQYGITSPKQSSKYGPLDITEEARYKIADLKSTLSNLANTLQIKGAAQIDLIFANNQWYIIEINPRLSGMSFMNCETIGISVFEMLYKTCIEKHGLPAVESKILDVKLPLMSLADMEEMLQVENIRLLNQTNDLAAKQEREKGFCECVIKAKSDEEIKNTVELLKNKFPEDPIIQQSESMLK